MAVAGSDCCDDGCPRRGALVVRISRRLHLKRSTSHGTGYTVDGSFDTWHLHNCFWFGSLSISPQNDSRWSGAVRGDSDCPVRPLPESRGRGCFPGMRMRWQLDTDPPLGMDRAHQLRTQRGQTRRILDYLPDMELSTNFGTGKPPKLSPFAQSLLAICFHCPRSRFRRHRITSTTGSRAISSESTAPRPSTFAKTMMPRSFSRFTYRQPRRRGPWQCVSRDSRRCGSARAARRGREYRPDPAIDQTGPSGSFPVLLLFSI